MWGQRIPYRLRHPSRHLSRHPSGGLSFSPPDTATHRARGPFLAPWPTPVVMVISGGRWQMRRLLWPSRTGGNGKTVPSCCGTLLLRRKVPGRTSTSKRMNDEAFVFTILVVPHSVQKVHAAVRVTLMYVCVFTRRATPPTPQGSTHHNLCSCRRRSPRWPRRWACPRHRAWCRTSTRSSPVC